MPDEFDFHQYKTMEEFGKSVEGVKFLHDLYLKAVNHPIRREILNVVNESKIIAKKQLFNKLITEKIISDDSMFDYNIDFLIKAFCLNQIERDDDIYYEITQSGKVVEYLDK